jgi:two-component system sensor histidine kinase PilS (NtrC family)
MNERTTAMSRADDRWAGLQTLIWARLLVAALALPLGVLLRPEPSLASWRLLGVALAVVGVLSALFWLGTAIKRGLLFQIYLQLSADLLLITAMSALTGGAQSPFALLYVLAVITGGLQGGLAGALVTAAAASAGLLALNPSGVGLVNPTWNGALPKPTMFAPLLVALGVLAAALRRRVQHAREHMERTARELDRIRFDNDVILRHLTSGVITLDGTGILSYLNPAAEEVLGITFAAVRGRWVQDALPERLHPLRDVLLGTLERQDTRQRGELLLSTAGGKELPLGISTNVLRHDDQVTGAVAVFQDLSAVREMEIQNRRNQTLAEVGALAAGIAHELRNGLSPISGSIEVLQRELKLEGENAQLMGLMQTECGRLNRFVTDLLSYSRERPLVKERFDLGESLGELCEGLQRDPRRAPSVTIAFEPQEGPTELTGDREQFRQVWLNLARNALEAMGEAGTLRVSWHEAGPDRVAVTFTDDGSGIAPDDLPRVGQPFFTTKKGGTGLGLPIAQRIVERHGGTLVLAPATRRGTVATVTIPGAALGLARAA